MKFKEFYNIDAFISFIEEISERCDYNHHIALTLVINGKAHKGRLKALWINGEDDFEIYYAIDGSEDSIPVKISELKSVSESAKGLWSIKFEYLGNDILVSIHG